METSVSTRRGPSRRRFLSSGKTKRTHLMALTSAILAPLRSATSTATATSTLSLVAHGADDRRAELLREHGFCQSTDLRERTGAGNILDSVNVGEWSSPCVRDLNGDGALDVVPGQG